MQPYRNDLESLEARHATLETEVADTVRQRDEAARMLEEARAQRRAASYARPRRPRRTLGVVVAASAVLLLLATVVCVKKRNKSERRMQHAATQLERLADEVCACPDRACAMAVQGRSSRWGITGVSTGGPAPETKRRLNLAGKRLYACMTKFADANIGRE